MYGLIYIYSLFPVYKLCISAFCQVSEAILNNAQLMLQTENIQANAEDFKDRCGGD